MKRLGVLGTFVWDTIHQPGAGGEPFEGWGGIAYSLAALSAAAPPGWEIVPLVKVGDDLAGQARDFLAALPGVISPAGVVVVAGPNNRVRLDYHDGANRCERQTGAVPSWKASELRPHLTSLDALYVNFVSGQEIALSGMQGVRAAFAGPVHADLHSLLLDRPGAGARRPRPLASWAEWVRCFDAVQLNRDELATQAQGEDPWIFAAREVAPAALLTLVTRGASGATALKAEGLPANPLDWPAFRSEGAGTRRVEVDAPVTRAVAGDPTGCGDVWGATLFLRLLAGDGLERSLAAAGRAAAWNAARRGTEGLARELRAVHAPVVP